MMGMEGGSVCSNATFFRLFLHNHTVRNIRMYQPIGKQSCTADKPHLLLFFFFLGFLLTSPAPPPTRACLYYPHIHLGVRLSNLQTASWPLPKVRYTSIITDGPKQSLTGMRLGRRLLPCTCQVVPHGCDLTVCLLSLPSCMMSASTCAPPFLILDLIGSF